MIVLAAVLFLGCAAKKAGQVVEPSALGSQYLTAVGIGQSEGEARNQARAEISKIFESRVFSNTYDRVSAVIENSRAETSKQQIESSVRVVSDVELRGVEIEKAWKKEGSHYARAVLDRYKARDNWTREMGNIDKMITGRLGALGSLESGLLKLRSLNVVSDLWVEREMLASRLSVIGFDYGGFPEYDIKSVYKTVAEIKKAMPVYIEILGEHGARMRSRVAEALGRRGYVITDNREGASVRIVGKVKVRPVELEGTDLKYARVIVAIDVTDAEAGLSVGEVTENKRAAHIFYREAVERAFRKVNPSISEKLIEHIEDEAVD
jgi:hypothetical protein